MLQECRVEPLLTVRETLELYAGYYSTPAGVDETIALVGLEGKADDRAGKLSGGQQRRLDVAMALIGDAELLFLDEPTTGFDPSARRQAWEVIASLRELGKTVFLTTHYMDEAQFLADRVAIIRDGLIVAEGAPNELGGRAEAASRIAFASARRPRICRTLEGSVAMQGSYVEITTTSPTRTLNELTEWAMERGDRAPRPLRVTALARGRVPRADRGATHERCSLSSGISSATTSGSSGGTRRPCSSR